MLTESEREWLEERVLLPCYSCKYCTGYHNQSCNAFEPLSSCWNRLCENFDFEYFDEEVFLDAADFSERVAVKLVRWENEYHKGDRLCPYGDTELDSYIPLCHCTDFCQSHPKLGCIAAKLAWVQLHVEEEMDGENS